MNIDSELRKLKGNYGFALGPKYEKSIIHEHILFDFKKKKIIFNNDMDFILCGKIEKALKILNEKFQIEKYSIEVYNPKAFNSVLDSLKPNKVNIINPNGIELDITLNLKKFEKDKIIEVILFIKNNFYSTKDWGCIPRRKLDY